MPPTTVLVGFAEALAGPEAVWSLVDAGFRVIAFARKGRASALRHSHHVEIKEVTAPEIDLSACLIELCGLLNSIRDESGCCVIMPLDDKALYLCDKVELPPGWVLAGPKGANAELALDKFTQVQAAQKAGFNVPKTALACTADDISRFAKANSFPIILKAAQCVPIDSGRVCSGGNWICANQAELDRALGQWAEKFPLLVQSFIAGVGEGIFGFAQSQGVKSWSAHRRIRMMNPEGSGSSACISQTVQADAKASAEAMICASHWRGLFMIELLRDLEGKLWFVELNGRAWGSLALTRRQGLEYPAWTAMQALYPENDLETIEPRSSGLVCRNVGRELVHILFVLRGTKSSTKLAKPSRIKTIWEVLRIHKGDTFYNWRGDDRKVFFADSYYTIRDTVFKTRH
jgi:hypothetical protein